MMSTNKLPIINLDIAMEFIASGQLTKAAKLTVAICKQENEEFFISAIVISMQIHTLEKAILGGRISWEQENQSKNEIAMRMLTLLEMISSD